MKISDLYSLIVELGRTHDPRPQDKILNYTDTAIVYGDTEKEIHNILVGIDIGAGELFLADKLRGKGNKIDIVLSHHPIGSANAGYPKAMEMQTSLLKLIGLKEKEAHRLNQKEIGKIERKIYSANYSRVSDLARLLDIPLMCVLCNKGHR